MKHLSLSVLLSVLVACGGNGITPAKYQSPELHRGARQLSFSHDVSLFSVTNGLMVALVPESNTNLVKVDVRYRVGAADDPKGKAGLAHLVEHVLFTIRPKDKKHGPTLGDELSAAALGYNAYTNWDETHYTATALSSKLDTLLRLEHRRMAASCEQIDDALLAREKLVVKQELLQRGVATGDVIEPLRKQLFGTDHPYTRSVGGNVAEVMSASRDDVCKFITKHYAPQRAILVVAGDISSSVRDRVGKLFGPIANRGAAKPTKVPAFEPHGRSTLRMDIDKPAVVLAFAAPRWDDPNEVWQRVLLTEILSKLRAEVDDSDALRSAGIARVGGFRAGAAYIYVVGLSDAKQTAAALAAFEHARDNAVKALKKERLRAVRTRWQAQVLRSLEPFQFRAVRIADYLQYAPTKMLMNADLRELSRLDHTTLERIASRKLALANASIVTVTPGKGGGGSLDVRDDTKQPEIALWRTPVNPADADKPISVPRQRQRYAAGRFTLANGLKVVVVPRLSYPLIDARLVFPVGAVDDPPGKRGLARLSANLLAFDFDRKYPVKDLPSITFIMEMGGAIDAEVGVHSTSFHIRGLGNHADGLLWQLQWWVHGGIHEADALTRAKAAVAREVKGDAISLRRQRVFAEALYGAGHPYADIVRTPQTGAISVDDLDRFARDHYHANGATLIVTGNFDAADVEARIKRVFGAFPAGKAAAPRDVPSFLVKPSAAAYAIVDADVVQPRVVVAFRAAAGFRGREAARLVLAEMLRQRTVRVRKKFGATYGVDIRYSHHRGPNHLDIVASLDPSHAGKALVALRAGLDELRAGKDLKPTFVRARRKVLERVMAASVDSNSVGNELERIAIHRLGANYFRALVGQVANLRPADVKQLIARELDDKNAVTLIVGNRNSVTALYGAAGVKNYRVMR